MGNLEIMTVRVLFNTALDENEREILENSIMFATGSSCAYSERRSEFEYVIEVYPGYFTSLAFEEHRWDDWFEQGLLEYCDTFIEHFGMELLDLSVRTEEV